jgi:hypothetical protein
MRTLGQSPREKTSLWEIPRRLVALLLIVGFQRKPEDARLLETGEPTGESSLVLSGRVYTIACRDAVPRQAP